MGLKSFLKMQIDEYFTKIGFSWFWSFESKITMVLKSF